MYYLIKTKDKYAFELEKFETIEDVIKDLNDSPWDYDYKAIIEGDMILEIKE